MTTRDGASGKQGDFFDLLAAPHEDQAAPRADISFADDEEIELADLQERLTRALKQARKGMLAAGSGEETIRRAFAAARRKE